MKHFFFLFICLMLIAQLSPVTAQADIVYLCVKPQSSAEPYLIGFKNTGLVGFVISEAANVTVYGTSDIHVGVYHILPDAPSGGYVRTGNVGTIQLTENLASARDCSTEYSSLITADMFSSIPLPVSDRQAVVIQNGGSNQLTDPFIGGVAMQFNADTSEGIRSMQILQMQAGPIELTFPFVRERTGYALIANKEITVKKSYFAEGKFRNTAVANDQEGMAEQLSIELGWNLIDIMEQGAFRIYPAYGFADEYFPTGFIRLEIGDAPAQRIPAFAEGQEVRALKVAGTEARYFLSDRPEEPFGNLQSPVGSEAPATLKVLRVDEQGQLWVDDGSGQEVIIEAWLVEVQ